MPLINFSISIDIYFRGTLRIRTQNAIEEKRKKKNIYPVCCARMPRVNFQIIGILFTKTSMLNDFDIKILPGRHVAVLASPHHCTLSNTTTLAVLSFNESTLQRRTSYKVSISTKKKKKIIENQTKKPKKRLTRALSYYYPLVKIEGS